MPTLRSSLLVPVVLTALLVLSGCTSVYDDTKGWGNDLWEEIKEGSKQASHATKEALDSINEDTSESELKSSGPKSSEIETSSLEPVKIPNGSTSTPTPLKDSEKAAQPPKVMPKGNYAVHLSSNKSKKSAEQEWTELRNAFPRETQGLKLRLKSVKITGKGTFYRVLGSAFGTKAAASKACEIFKKKKQYCVAVKL
ncbi:hypothetical protein A9Q97_05165 [Rhodospirillales bacterium 47_12_T64]|nr:hypothetical protein A9Q97_05165 [Rhodospirillales bacterium 47_12_T64]